MTGQSYWLIEVHKQRTLLVDKVDDGWLCEMEPFMLWLLFVHFVNQ